MDVTFSVVKGKGGDIGKILLNRPQNLNALNLPMCTAIFQHLQQWAAQDSIKAVIIQGAGERAFCAGGDVRQMYENVQHGQVEEVMDFFQQEYRMNTAIFNFPKPYIAFLDGITMGGGVGLSIHGSHAIASERLTWAMPETRIGFFPDVAVGYHLVKLADYAGYYLGLTGERLSAADAYHLGLVQAVAPSDQLAKLEEQLINTAFSATDFDVVTHIIAEFHQQPDPKTRILTAHLDSVKKYFSGDSVEEIIDGLQQSADAWCQSTANTLMAQSPLSLKVTYQHLQHCEHFDFAQVMTENLQLTKQFIENPDFIEGIRAAVIDKDRHPQWRLKTLSAVTPEIMKIFFG